MISTALLLTLLVAFIDDDRRRSIRRWFLLTANRWKITGILVVLIFVILMVLGITPLVRVAERTFSTSIFGAIASGLLSLVPIVITVNQLTISQLVATPEQLRNRIQSVQHFRMGIEEKLSHDMAAPTDPGEFLLIVNDLIAERATTLRDAAENINDRPKADCLVDYAEKILTESNELADTVTSTDLPLLEILLPIMDDEHSQNINTARTVRKEYPEAVSHQMTAVLKELEDLFVSKNVIQQYFKALYIQEALAKLSKLIAYTGGGAFILALASVMIFAGEKPLPIHPLLIQMMISAAAALSLTPIALLLAHIARIGTIVKHTVAPGAFTPRTEEDVIMK